MLPCPWVCPGAAGPNQGGEQGSLSLDWLHPDCGPNFVGVRRFLRHAARNLLLALANGFILVLFSERLFWSVWRPGDSVPDLIVTWLAYSTLAYLFLATVRLLRADDVWSVYLAGAVYGWLTEGGLIHTLYGTEESAPFPISLIITGVSWHALISVLVGWYATGKALGSPRPARTAVLASGVGIFWGCWATFLWRETPPVVTPAPEFFAYATLMNLMLVGAWWVNLRVGWNRFRPGWVGGSLCLLILGAFYAQHVLRLGWRPVVILPAVLGAALVPLWMHRRRRPEPPAILEGQRVARNLAWLGLMPLTATAVYVAAGALRLDQVPVATIVYYWTTGPLGFLLLVVAMFRCARGRKGGVMPTASHQPEVAGGGSVRGGSVVGEGRT